MGKEESFIPENFDEAVDYLVSEFQGTGNSPQDFGWHHAGGRNLRNQWGLWGNETSIAKWFSENSLDHADDRSAILSEAVDARLNGVEFDVLKRIKHYREYWISRGQGLSHNCD